MNIIPYLPLIFFIFVTLFFVMISIVLVYHWRRYAKGDAKVALFETVYFVVGAVLLISAFSLMWKL
jgi:hypothetical protein